MTISRITTWIDGQVLTAAALNGEFDNIINNPVTLVFPIPAGSGALDLNYNPVNKLVVGTNSLSTIEGGLSASAGLGLLLYNDGVTARILGPQAGLGRVMGLGGSLISNIGSFAAQGYQLQRVAAATGSASLMNIACTSSFSVNTQLAGPVVNGRDQAAAFASDEVHFYAIQQGRHGSTTISGIASTRPPPLGPNVTGFYWAYLCSAKYTVATSSITYDSVVRGSWVDFTPFPELVSSGSATSATE